VSARLDRALDVLDVGLQRPTPGHGGEPVAADLCVRCQAGTPVEGTAWCAACQQQPLTPAQVRDLVDALNAVAAEIVRVVVPAFTRVYDTLVAAGLITKTTPGCDYTCPRHGPQDAAFCRSCVRKHR
jgi:hypothetical protein